MLASFLTQLILIFTFFKSLEEVMETSVHSVLQSDFRLEKCKSIYVFYMQNQQSLYVNANLEEN